MVRRKEQERERGREPAWSVRQDNSCLANVSLNNLEQVVVLDLPQVSVYPPERWDNNCLTCFLIYPEYIHMLKYFKEKYKVLYLWKVQL